MRATDYLLGSKVLDIVYPLKIDDRPLDMEKSVQNATTLEMFTRCIEAEVSNYELVKTENLHDEEYDMVLNMLLFSRGNDDWTIVIGPHGEIRSVQKDTPRDLILQVHNTLTDLLYRAIAQP
tara:strand:+ start:968 stop:1333 length:366 start_codon:yes stop_codon:yes gene_type:complete